jgi:mRNA interferase RelE/StbE
VTYRLVIKPSASKELERLDDQMLRRVDAAILRLRENPQPQGSKKLAGVPLYRIRVGSYRVVYEIDDVRKQVTVVTIGHRREVYRR